MHDASIDENALPSFKQFLITLLHNPVKNSPVSRI
jgi:hypothetical protein